MKFDTTRFGQIEVSPEDIVIFPEGPLGFPDCTRFTLIEEEKAFPFKMLQSLDNPALAFVTVDPLKVRSDYHFNVTREDLKLIKAEDTENLSVLTIVTMAKDIREITVNLQGPLVINVDQRLGHQFVLVESGYTTREALIRDYDAVQEYTAQAASRPADLEMPQKKAV